MLGQACHSLAHLVSAPSGSCSSSPPSHTVFKDWNLRPPPSHSLPLLDSLTPTSLSLHLTQSVSLNHILHSTWMSLHPKPSLSQTKSVIFPHHPPHLTIILLSIQLHQANPEGPPGSTLIQTPMQPLTECVHCTLSQLSQAKLLSSLSLPPLCIPSSSFTQWHKSFF